MNATTKTSKDLNAAVAEAKQTASKLGYAVSVYQTSARTFAIVARGVTVERGLLVGHYLP